MTGYERRRLTPEEANALFDVIVATCAAHESMRDQWLSYAAREDPSRFGLEFRFMGNLGFGGKLVYDGLRPAHVTYGHQERNPESDAQVARTNDLLAAVPHPFVRRA